jgi:DNA invertase Pin-like site-specific DNA recombinase
VGRVELILVTEVSRLFRNLADAIKLLNLVRSTPLSWVETTGGAVVAAAGGAGPVVAVRRR